MGLTPKEMAEAQQGAAAYGDFASELWARIYRNLCAQGFKPDSAFVLLQTYIASQGQASYVISPPTTIATKEDEQT